MPVSMFSAALIAALIGYGSTIALVLAAAQALGATPAQTASWLLALCLAKAAGSAFLSWRHKIPVILAWSTPGAALIATTQGIDLPHAAAAFIIAGGLTALTGMIKPLERAIAYIPDGIAAAMLAGVLLPFCLKLPVAVGAQPILCGMIILCFMIARWFTPTSAILAALAGGVAYSFLSGMTGPITWHIPAPYLEFIPPQFSFSTLISLAIPLYLVTMATQNLPGFAILRTAGYQPPIQSALSVNGLLSSLIGFFGAHSTSMAAITAAICMGSDVHPNPQKRWPVGLFYGACWTTLAFLSPLILKIFAALPPELITAIVGLALLPSLMGSCAIAFKNDHTRFSATIGLIVTASGMAFWGIGAAFWGLAAGMMFHFYETIRTKT